MSAVRVDRKAASLQLCLVMLPRPLVIALAFCVAASLPAAAAPVDWADLRPPSQPAQLTVQGAGELGRTFTQALDSQTVEITGFLLPADRDGDLVMDFLLVPWAGACSHTPPPAPNQVLRVHPAEPYKAQGIYEVVTVTGRLTGGRDLTQLFIFDGVATIESAYHLESATVIGRGMSDREPAHGRSPWSFLRR
ncbi:MAG: DUF3299 domain-containing protein [Rhizobiaceae bacterium]|nr:DUF3299 domain-containing protein [Rhizobiaceae bacterium]